ncbi:MAG: hypothetical protein ACTSQI_19010 [Candidatus Helarchaeota archaeon]
MTPPHQVYWQKIYGARIQYDHALKAYLNSIEVVDLVACDLNDRVFLNDCKVYLTKKFVATHSWRGYRFRFKVALLSALLFHMVHKLHKAAIPKNSIWVLADSGYNLGEFEQRIRDLGENFMLQLKKDRWTRLFQRWIRMDQYFTRYKPVHYFTPPSEHKKVFYKEAILAVSKFRRRKVIAFKEGHETVWRYFMVSKLD